MLFNDLIDQKTKCNVNPYLSMFFNDSRGQKTKFNDDLYLSLISTRLECQMFPRKRGDGSKKG